MVRYEYKYYDEGQTCSMSYNDNDHGFYSISKMIAFDDCGPGLEELHIECDSREVRYCGWEPGMSMTYRYIDTDEVAYHNQFEQWDH